MHDLSLSNPSLYSLVKNLSTYTSYLKCFLTMWSTFYLCIDIINISFRHCDIPSLSPYCFSYTVMTKGFTGEERQTHYSDILSKNNQFTIVRFHMLILNISLCYGIAPENLIYRLSKLLMKNAIRCFT